MAEYYRSEINRPDDNRHRRSLPWVIVDFVVAITSAVTMFLAVLILIMRYVPPQQAGMLSVLGLGAPLVYMVLLLLMLYWLLRWRIGWIIGTMICVLWCTAHLSLYYKFDFKRDYGTRQYERGLVKVLSYNVHIFRDRGWHDIEDQFLDFVKRVDADIICLQEFCDDGDAQKWVDNLRYAKSTIGKGWENSTEIIVCGRNNQLLRSEVVDSLSRTEASWADVTIGMDTVRVLSLHLHTTGIKEKDSRFLESYEYVSDTTRDQKLRSMVSRLTESNRKRADEVRHIREFIQKSPYKVILCGDFNDVPMSYCYRSMARGLKDTFREAGSGYQHTYNGFFYLMRIDYILCSPQIEVVSHEVIDTAVLSDHHPILARLKFKKPKR